MSVYYLKYINNNTLKNYFVVFYCFSNFKKRMTFWSYIDFYIVIAAKKNIYVFLYN